MTNIRQPIVTVAGHVDHGKTSILDSIRESGVQSSEAGGITQKISFTKVPITNIKSRCPLIEKNKINVNIPGFLFIDTPGHAAFSHLRKRGGSLADLAILVMDVSEGIMPQTGEVLEILKLNKIPFVIALNKIDNISGWRKQSDQLKESIDMQSTNTKMQFDEKVMTIMGSLHHHGFDAKLFYDIKDFSKELALIPVSAKTGEGIEELIMMLCGLSQKFLAKILELNTDAKGVILEIKKEKNLQYADSIVYDGTLSKSDTIAIASFDDPIVSKIRILEEIQPISNKFKSKSTVTAATGIRMQLVNPTGILPGMPFTLFKDNLEEIKEEFNKDLGDKLSTDKKGIIIKADALGSLEALITLLKQKNVKIISAGIGPINKKDLMQARANLKINPIDAIIVGFNTDLDDEVKEMDVGKVTILTNEVIYKLIDDLILVQEEKEKVLRKERLMQLATITKLKILPQFVFRNQNPAVFGVTVVSGKIKKGIPLINIDNKSIAKIKDIQENRKSVDEALEGKDIAISLPGINFERQLTETEELYSDLTEKQFQKFKSNKDLLTVSEIQTLQKIAEIKRKHKITWGV